MADWRIKNSFSTSESVLWTNAGTTANQTRPTIWKVTKYSVRLLRLTVSGYEFLKDPRKSNELNDYAQKPRPHWQL